MLNKINELENWISINQFSSLDAVNETMVLDAGAVVEFIKSLKDDLDEGQMVLDAPARVGGGIFQKGIKWSTVIGAAQRLYENEIRDPIKPIVSPADMLRIATGELVLVPKNSIYYFYQDNDEPENFCSSEADFNCLGDCIEIGEIMEINKITQASIKKDKLFGTWFAEAINPTEKANFFVGTKQECEAIVKKNNTMLESYTDTSEDK